MALLATHEAIPNENTPSGGRAVAAIAPGSRWRVSAGLTAGVSTCFWCFLAGMTDHWLGNLDRKQLPRVPSGRTSVNHQYENAYILLLWCLVQQ